MSVLSLLLLAGTAGFVKGVDGPEEPHGGSGAFSFQVAFEGAVLGIQVKRAAGGVAPMVAQVVPGGQAEYAGVQVGDKISRVANDLEDHPVSTFEEFMDLLPRLGGPLTLSFGSNEMNGLSTREREGRGAHTDSEGNDILDDPFTPTWFWKHRSAEPVPDLRSFAPRRDRDTLPDIIMTGPETTGSSALIAQLADHPGVIQLGEVCSLSQDQVLEQHPSAFVSAYAQVFRRFVDQRASQLALLAAGGNATAASVRVGTDSFAPAFILPSRGDALSGTPCSPGVAPENRSSAGFITGPGPEANILKIAEKCPNCENPTNTPTHTQLLSLAR